MPARFDSLTLDLEARFRGALAAVDTAALFAWLDHTIHERTLRGEFLPGSSPDAARYADTAHVRRREEKGRQVAHVDLYFGYDADGDPKPHMLDGMKGQAEAFEDEVRAAFGYIEGLADDEAARLARYHHTGEFDKRLFVGLTDAERDEAVRLIREDVLRALR